MSIKIYKAIDALDDRVSLFAVKDDKMLVSSYDGEDDVWLDAGFFDEWVNWDVESLPFDKDRFASIPVLVAEHSDA